MKHAGFFFLFITFMNTCSFGQSAPSRHFTIHKLASGVYAAIATNGGYAICNAGIIDLGRETLVFDPFMSPEAAEDLKKVAYRLTGHPVKYVVNSHFHNDHISGDQVFDQAVLISTERTRDLIARFQPEEIEEDRKNAAASLNRVMQEPGKAMGTHAREEQVMWKGYYEALVKSGPSIRVVLPDLCFQSRISLQGSRHKVEIISYGQGHTESDAIVFLPDEKIVFAGDLLFINNHPWMGDGNPEAWTASLDSLAGLNPRILVPGHGPVGNTASLDSLKRYFAVVRQAALSCLQRGTDPEKDSSLQPPAPYDRWFLSNFFRPNVDFVYKRLGGR